MKDRRTELNNAFVLQEGEESGLTNTEAGHQEESFTQTKEFRVRIGPHSTGSIRSLGRAQVLCEYNFNEEFLRAHRCRGLHTKTRTIVQGKLRSSG
jgi:hypothetical protein